MSKVTDDDEERLRKEDILPVPCLYGTIKRPGQNQTQKDNVVVVDSNITNQKIKDIFENVFTTCGSGNDNDSRFVTARTPITIISTLESNPGPQTTSPSS
eukprot:c19851_g1_i1.p1 GENE.c19851_g1_i1~~c19851_g1_i1.p1  ORF type:complete len:100 (+),score=41.23 c19851_g1_i1:18-317(+)